MAESRMTPEDWAELRAEFQRDLDRYIKEWSDALRRHIEEEKRREAEADGEGEGAPPDLPT
jgi:hypothetical protein